MSDSVEVPSVHGTNSESGLPRASASQLRGGMGTLELVMTVLAFTAPLAVVGGFIPVVVLFNGTGAVGAYVVATAVLLLFAVGYVAMSKYLPNAGAFYAYVSAGLGRIPGLGAAYLATYGYYCFSLSGLILAGFYSHDLVTAYGGPDISWYVYSLLVWGIVGGVGYLNIAVSARALAVVMLAEVTIVLVYDLVVFGKGGADGVSVQPFGFDAFTSGSTAIAVMFAATCFSGFEATALFRDEAKSPDKTVPKATYLAVLFIGVFYIVTTWAFVTAIGPAGLASLADTGAGLAFTSTMGEFVGQLGADLVAPLLVTSTVASLLAAQNILSRYFYTQSLDSALPAPLSKVHPKFKSPHRCSVATSAVLLAGIVAIVIADGLGADPWQLFAAAAGAAGYAILILMLMTCAAVILYFHRMRTRADVHVWKRVWAPAGAAIGLGTIVVLATKNFSLLAGSQTAAVLMLIITAAIFVAGAAVALYFRSNKPDIYALIGRRGVVYK